jgi:hypothetical protein
MLMKVQINFKQSSSRTLKSNFVLQKKVRTSGDYSGSDEEEHDAYLEQMKAEGAERNDNDSDSEGAGNLGINPPPPHEN